MSAPRAALAVIASATSALVNIVRICQPPMKVVEMAV